MRWKWWETQDATTFPLDALSSQENVHGKKLNTKPGNGSNLICKIWIQTGSRTGENKTSLLFKKGLGFEENLVFENFESLKVNILMYKQISRIIRGRLDFKN